MTHAMVSHKHPLNNGMMKLYKNLLRTRASIQWSLNNLYASGMASARVACRYHPDAPLIEDYRAGDLICPECGLVVGDRVIDVGSEWRSLSETEMIQ